MTFLGRVADEGLPEWLGASDLMVMDCRSRWLGLEQEGFGIVFVEAAACGVAQIAGRSGGSHEAVRDGVTGLVVANPRSARPRRGDGDAAPGPRASRAFGRDVARVAAVEQFDWDACSRAISRRARTLRPRSSIGQSA